MQWLNTFDDVLEKALKPRQNREPHEPPPSSRGQLLPNTRLAISSRADSPSTLTEASDRSLPLPPPRYILPSAPLSLPGSVRRTKATLAGAPIRLNVKRAPLDTSEDEHDDEDNENDGSSGREKRKEKESESAPTHSLTCSSPKIKKPVMRLPSHESQLSRTSSSASATSQPLSVSLSVHHHHQPVQVQTLYRGHVSEVTHSHPIDSASETESNAVVEVTETAQLTPTSEDLDDDYDDDEQESSHHHHHHYFAGNNNDQPEQQHHPTEPPQDMTTPHLIAVKNSYTTVEVNDPTHSTTFSCEDSRTSSSSSSNNDATPKTTWATPPPLNPLAPNSQLNVVVSNSSNLELNQSSSNLSPLAEQSTTPVSALGSSIEPSSGTLQDVETEESWNGDDETSAQEETSNYEEDSEEDSEGSGDESSGSSFQDEEETSPSEALGKEMIDSRSEEEKPGNSSLPTVQREEPDVTVRTPYVLNRSESDVQFMYNRGDSLLSSRSLPRQVELRCEFDVGELRPSWTTTSVEPFDTQKNCYGVFSVRVLRAQRLPCSVGSSVQAVVSLLPWTGKVRTQKTRAFSSKQTRYGVCARWGEETPPISMVHAYSSEETPVPTIRVDLVFKLVFEFSICSLEVSCEQLMAAPGCPKRQWFAATTTVGDKQALKDVLEIPILEIEAMFEPSHFNREIDSVESIDEVDMAPMESIDVGSVCSSLNEEVVTLPTPSVRVSGASPRREYPTTTTDDASLSQHSIIKSEGKNLHSTPHMLHAVSYWTPATCCVCKRSILSGLSKARSFHCEVCKIDCCNDCRLHVDIQLPCGSRLAARARSKAIQNKLTMENIMNTVAPVSSTADETTAREEDDGSVGLMIKGNITSVHSQTTASTPAKQENGIGSVRFDFIRALVYENPIPSDSDPEVSKDDLKIKKGDYYIRVSWSGGTDTKRTRTMQNTGRPKFDSAEIKFTVPHYGTEFRVELVDATTNKPIGAGIVTTQSLLQRQRDAFVEKRGLPILPFHGPPKLDAQHFNLELRSGLKASADFFSPSKSQTGSPGDKTRVGDIVGSIELRALMEEDVSSLFGRFPYECPPRPPDDLNMALFGVHLARLFSLIEDIRKGLELYVYVVSWKNPLITLASLVLFVESCLRVDLEYIGSFPLFFLIVWMLYLAFSRSKGGLKNGLLNKEVEAYTKTLEVAIDHTLHRPAGKISVAVDCGRNIRSADLGLPGIVGCRVYWNPTRFLDSHKRPELTVLDKASDAVHEICATNYLYSMHPNWGKVEASDEAKRLKHLLPCNGDGEFFEGKSDQTFQGVDFPILQPVSQDGELLALQSWSESPGAIIFEVKFQDAISLLPGSEYSIGEVVIPFSKLSRYHEISGWFQVLEAGTTRMVARGNGGTEGDDVPQINIRVKWTPPLTNMIGPSETEREASFVIQEELVRSALASKDQKLGLVGTSLGAINTVRGLTDYLLLVQNTLGFILDLIGSTRSAFNFSDPYRSTLLFFAFFALWVVLVVIPTRVLVLAGGLAQYVATFWSKFGHLVRQKLPPQNHKTESPRDINTPPSPYATWIVNAIRGFPTDEDIRKTYFWECRRLRARKSTEIAESKRKARLQRLWRAQFYSSVSMLRLIDKGQSDRFTVFAMIQGHRFLWWRSVEAFDKGEEPLGLIFLSGHAGLATPSPLELRCIDKEELPRVACIFGRGRETQERVTIVTPSAEVTVQLEHAVSFATSVKKD